MSVQDCDKPDSKRTIGLTIQHLNTTGALPIQLLTCDMCHVLVT